MPSNKRPLLRTQLLTWLLVPLSMLLAADTFVSYRVALDFSQRAYDRTLVEIAREVSLYLRAGNGGLSLEMPDEARRLLFNDPVDRVHFEVAAADGRLVAGEKIAPAPRSPARRKPELLYDGEVGGAPVRVIEVSVAPEASSGRPAATVRVAETKQKRNSLAHEILLSVVIPQVLLIFIAGIVVWMGVVRGLSPIERLQRAVSLRSPRDCSPLVVESVPGELAPLLDSLNELLARLDRVLTLQSRFVSDAAHQLKTPMSALSAQFELALREQDPARMREAMKRVEPGLERLTRLVSQLLSLARNEPEAVRAVTLAPLDLGELALDLATGWVPAARGRGIDLGFEGEGRPVMVEGDAVRLRELLENLLDNAVRYTAAGGRVTVRVAASPQPSCSISDDGPAIPPEERSRVFERFHRLLGSSRDGSGLGLAIALEIARLHGAEITLRDDADGVGNTFIVTFPPVP